ncbi:mannosyltransferase OCH1-like enzyme [Bradyrhizobium sp. USDA 3240]
MTNYTADVTLSVYVNYLFNRCMAPTHEFRFCSDVECEAFVRSQHPEHIETYLSLRIGAARTDFWRVLVLLAHGGVYVDIDAAFCWPPELMLSVDQSELFVLTKDDKLTNYFLAAEPTHPVLAKIATKIAENITSGTMTSIYDMTGPTVVDLIAGGILVRAEPFRLVCLALKGYWAREEEKGPNVVRRRLKPAIPTVTPK